MNRILITTIFGVVAVLSAGAPAAAQTDGAGPVGTAFNYQGRIKLNGSLITSAVDLQFSLWEGDCPMAPPPPCPALQVGSTISMTNITPSNGLFSAVLDFGPTAFNGNARWLQLAVRHPAGSGLYVPVFPRQALNPAPYSIWPWRPSTSIVGSIYFNSGNIGIGTTDPQRLLQVGGGNPTQPGIMRMISGHATGSTPWDIGVTDSAGPDPGSFIIAELGRGLEPEFFIRAGGHQEIGIGTSNPKGKLHVKGDNYQSGIAVGGEWSYLAMLDVLERPLWQWGRTAENGVVNDDLRLTRYVDGVFAGYPMYVTESTGNVGINAATPSARLHILGNDGGGPDGPIRIESVGDNGALLLDANEINNTSGHLFINGDNANEVHMVMGGGRVGIGVDPQGDRLAVNGSVCAFGGFVACSDLRFKSDILGLDHGLHLIAQMRPVRFNWRIDEFPDRNFPATPQLGFIAQELEPVVPEAVTRNDAGYYSVDYTRLVPVLTSAMQELLQQAKERDASMAEQQRQIDAERERGNQQQDLIEQQQMRIDALIARLAAIEARLSVDYTINTEGGNP